MEESTPNITHPDSSELMTRDTVDVILLFPGGMIREFRMKSRNVNETIGFEQGLLNPRFFVKSRMEDPEKPGLWIYELKSLKLTNFMAKFKNKRNKE